MENLNLKKVAFILSGLRVGGAEKFAISLINNFIKRGVKVYLILYAKHESPLFDEIDKNTEIIFIERRSKYDLSIGKRLKNVAEDNGISNFVVVGMFPFFLSKFGFKSSSKYNFFLSLHSTNSRSRKEAFQNRIYLKFLEKKDRIIYICKNQVKYFEKYFSIRNREFVVYNGIDTTYFSLAGMAGNRENDDNLIREKFNIPDDSKIILLVATLRIEKGHIYAIQSLKLLHDEFKMNNAHIIFVGNGSKEYVEHLMNQVKSLQLTSYVHFAGNQKDVRPYYNIANLFTLTSYSIETFSIAALEAMSFGVPCSLTDIGGASEMIIPSKNGELSQAKDVKSIAKSWVKILHGNYDRNFIKNNVNELYTVDKMVDKYLEIIFN